MSDDIKLRPRSRDELIEEYWRLKRAGAPAAKVEEFFNRHHLYASHAENVDYIDDANADKMLMHIEPVDGAEDGAGTADPADEDAETDEQS